ncbi:MAG: peptidoglycan-associated lipoprotein, partial [Aquabacterium sp.]
LALGQKRAEAVRKALMLLGAPEGAIESISFGKEKPKAACHEESCWSQNRRVDFVQLVKQK